jgi:hypothetical protein
LNIKGKNEHDAKRFSTGPAALYAGEDAAQRNTAILIQAMEAIAGAAVLVVRGHQRDGAGVNRVHCGRRLPMTFRQLHTEVLTEFDVPPEHIAQMQRGVSAMGNNLDKELTPEELPAIREWFTGIVKMIHDDPIARAAIYLTLKPEMEKKMKRN